MRRSVVIGAAAFLLGISVLGAWVQYWWQAPLDLSSEGVRVNVAAGETLGEISMRLAEEGVLRQPLMLNLIARASGADQRIRRGEFQLDAGGSPRDLLALLQSDATVRYQVTLPEGITLAQALQLLHEAEALEAELSDAQDPRLLALVLPASNPEGYFLPETYQYQRGDSDFDVLAQAHRMMRDLLADRWSKRSLELPYQQPYDALIMASIIERETGAVSERREIAGVFRRRLERGMRLQTDPTVIYGLGPRFDGNLTRAHLRDEENPYNTYRQQGLPPGPICLPGRAAVEAALDPAAGDALYFVAKGNGNHAFSATLEQHEQAVREYQLQRRSDYRSSPGREDK